MKRICVTIVLAIYICNILFVIGLGAETCFKFTWRGNSGNEISSCEKHSNYTPCVEPLDNSIIKPNTTELWEKRKENYFCNVNSDDVCVRYTYIFTDAVVNVSYFCGKVIEDQTSAVTSGCYTQQTDGYTIEVCACQSANNVMPCNATIKNTYSMLITIGAIAVTLFVYKIFNIP